MKTSREGNNLIINIVVFLLVMVAVFMAFTMFYNANDRRISGQNENYVTDITIQRANLVRDLFNENTSYIESAAMVLQTEFENRELDPAKLNVNDEADIDPAQIEIVGDVLQEYEDKFSFSYLRFIDAKGRDYTTEKDVIQANVRDRDYFARAIHGDVGMSYILDSKVTSERQVGFYAPVRMDGEIIGLVIGFYGEEFMREILSMTMFGYDCEVLLCGEDGTVIYNTFGNDNYDNFITEAKTGKALADTEEANVESAFREKQNTLFDYTEGEEKSIGYISYVTDNPEVFLVMNFPARAYRSMMNNANRNGVELLAILVALFAALLIFYSVRFITQRRRLIREAKNSNDIHSAMSSLFENFIIVDARSGEYNYIEGMPEQGKIPEIGAYQVFLEDLLARFVQEDEREAARRLLDLDRVKAEMNAGRNILSYNLHAPLGAEEWFTYNYIVVSRDQGTVREFIIARQDITALQKREERIRADIEAARDEAEKSNRAKSDFLSNMSHDIRTPMNAIIGYTNIAKSHREEPETVSDALEKIGSSSQYLLSLINDILDMSKIESSKVQLSTSDTDLNEIFDRIVDITRAQAERKKLAVHIDTLELVHARVKADELRFEQIMINIVSNAIKYTPDGGEIFITAQEEPKPGAASQYSFSVRDTGVGINPDFLPHIFESFSREKNSRIDKIQGTGLGMAITARLVELMGGTIDVESTLGEGSEFTVRLPLELAEEPAAEDASGAAAAEEALDTEGLVILLVEDNDVNAEIAMMVLEQYGIRTERAADGRQGLEMMQQGGEAHYDAVLMDIQMPVMNGYEATRAIRALEGDYYQDIPIIAMSANAYEEDVQNSLESGMNAHVSKPFDPEVLVKTLQKHISRRGKENAEKS